MRFSVIGVGLIGGSLGYVLKKAYPRAEIIGFGRSLENLKSALKKKAITRIGSSLADVAGSDVVFICTPVGKVAETARAIKKFVSPNTIVTDVGSTKSNIVSACEKVLASRCHFIGGHPMAGSEQHGVDAARIDLFENTAYILTPTKQTDATAYERLYDVLKNTGASIYVLDPKEHDRIVASVSHLPHIAAAALVNGAVSSPGKGSGNLIFAAGGFRDTTRIAASKPEIWVDICMDNKKAILELVGDYEKEIKQFKKAITAEDRPGLRKLFAAARKRRLDLPQTYRMEAANLVDLSVIVKDRPGVIMQVSLVLGKHRVNIRNIELLHTTGNEGILLLSVDEGTGLKPALKELAKLGFSANIEDMKNSSANAPAPKKQSAKKVVANRADTGSATGPKKNKGTKALKTRASKR